MTTKNSATAFYNALFELKPAQAAKYLNNNGYFIGAYGWDEIRGGWFVERTAPCPCEEPLWSRDVPENAFCVGRDWEPNGEYLYPFPFDAETVRALKERIKRKREVWFHYRFS